MRSEASWASDLFMSILQPRSGWVWRLDWTAGWWGVPGYSAWSRAEDFWGVSRFSLNSAEVLPGPPTQPAQTGSGYFLRRLRPSRLRRLASVTSALLEPFFSGPGVSNVAGRP